MPGILSKLRINMTGVTVPVPKNVNKSMVKGCKIFLNFNLAIKNKRKRVTTRWKQLTKGITYESIAGIDMYAEDPNMHYRSPH